MADSQHRGVPGVLWLTGTSYGLSFEGSQLIHLILGPATTALAVPLYRSRKLVWASLAPIVVTLLFGAPFAIISATGIAAPLGAEHGGGRSRARSRTTEPAAQRLLQKLANGRNGARCGRSRRSWGN